LLPTWRRALPSENDATGKYDLAIAKAQRSLRRRETVIDGPFAETKELVLGDWPLSPGAFARRAIRDGYADVNGLRMYYEVHGSGRPVLLHGGLSTIDQEFGSVVRTLSYGRQVIAVEQQAHGRTADIDRALSCEQMADDTAALLRQLDVEQADFFGFSMGGAAALQIAIRHPQLARKLAIVSQRVGAVDREAGVAPNGDPVPLADQDRAAWDQALTQRGLAGLERAKALGRKGPYALQAAIAACHARAETRDATDWARIAELYHALAPALQGYPFLPAWDHSGSGATEVHARFLRKLTDSLLERKDVFRGMIGPADPGHADHFHFDVAPWRYVRL
jgi:pimeloyl-ACP methyl ester carboxylesterase